MRLEQDDFAARTTHLDELDALGCDTARARKNIENHLDYDLFVYMSYYESLVSKGVDVLMFPASASDTDPRDRRRMDALFNTVFRADKDMSIETVFAGCNGTRDKIARLSALTETELMMILNNLDVEHVIRKYAEAILYGDVKDLTEVMNQSFGKPMERHVNYTQHVSPLEGLTTEQLKAMIEVPMLEEGEDDGYDD